MLRVMYRWRVEPENFDEFRETWAATTNRIHETVEGAKGSFLLRSCDDEREVTTIAKWDSKESWEKFWGNADPQKMHAMRSLAQRVSVDAYEEIEDHTRD